MSGSDIAGEKRREETPLDLMPKPQPPSRCEQAAREAEDAIRDGVAAIRRLRELKPPYDRLGGVDSAITALQFAVRDFKYALDRLEKQD